MIYILTGDIRTGKTSALLDWVKNQTDKDGIVCPDGNDGMRYFLKIKSRQKLKLEVQPDSTMPSDNILEIGPFQFLKSAFDEANNYLLQANEIRDFKYLIIDEIGKLELKNKGLYNAAKVLIPAFVLNEYSHLLLVIRKSLLDEVLMHYKITHYSVLEKTDLVNLI
jgi:nucleoside-triphosphatase THEP1